ncbi:purine-cytosine permease family protein [Streptomyces purpurogeneiscleroticus]|uniref:purine-cytosine permease family protein n=1 Tax=Streptomyces purpurogeneiscleroticus TaxID=68259 RepID=UPI001CBBACC4|nr:cytosine permease [Streptomyces purpurogeneiscleroticus]MBZ4014752.1 nitrate reductase [Streptomyces purpurogeneiscleroticus]
MASTLPDPQPDTHRADDAPPASGRAGRIEAHGIDRIPETERHGKARELFSVWAAANVNYLSLVVGGALILMGLSLGQAIAVLVVGNLFWVLTGFLAVSGPAAGAPSEVITRAIYGILGNRVNNAIVGWTISVCYFALNLSAAAVAAFSLVEKAGIPATTGVKIAVVVVIAALTLTISVYGHAMIMKLYLPITLVLAAVFAVVAVGVVGHADFSYTPAEPLTGVDLWATLIAGVTLIASGPLSYTTSADFSRYLPSATSKKAIVGWTALGGFVPSMIVCSLGAFAATAVDMTDPQTALEKILPGWFTPVFLLALVLGTVSLNALTAYSAGLALQAVGLRIRRSVSVLFDGAAAVALTLYALLVSNFLDTVSNVLQLTVVLLGPSMAVYATDILLRRNRYDGLALTDETRGSTFWYTGGVNRAGALALTAGTAAAALCVNTLYTGPLARALHGVDLALPVGICVASAVYALMTRRA